jgi:hypothetical protein
MGDIDLVLAHELLGVFGVERDIGLSYCLSSILRPSNPPAALISSTARLFAITIGLP